MKTASFYTSLVYLIFLNLLVKPLWIFGVDRQVQNLVGPETYGQYYALFSLSLVLSFFADGGLTQLMNRQTAAGESTNTRQLIFFKFLLSVLYALLVFAIAYASGIRQWHVLALVVLIQVLTSFFLLLRNLVTAHQAFSTDAVLSVIDKLLMLALLLPLLYTSLASRTTIYFFLYTQVFCTTLSIVVAIVVLYKKRLFVSGAVQSAANVFKSVLPYAAIIVLMAAHNRLDSFLLERLHPRGAYEAGLYASAYRLLDAGNMIGYLVATFLFPFMARHQSNTALVSQTVLTCRQWLLLPGSVATLFLIFFAAPVQGLLYPAIAADATLVLQCCIAVLPAYLLLHIYGTLLTATAQFKTLIFLLVFSFLINTVLNLLLIPRYGAVGCCIAAIVSQFSCALGAMIADTRFTRSSVGAKSGAVLLLALLCCSILFYWGRQQAVHPLLLAAIAAVGCAVLLFSQIPHFKKYFVSLR